MSFIQKLFKPKWQHSDPEVRKQALLSLAGDEAQEIYRNIIENEPELEVLNIALKRISDFETLKNIAESEKNRKIKTQALELAAKMLCGNHPNSPLASERKEIVSALDNKSLLEEVAKHADLEELRRIALVKLDKASLWMEAASSEDSQQLKDLALEHINDTASLERLINNTKRKDKYINRLAKEKLQLLVDLENAPLIAAEKRQTLLQAVSHLGRKEDLEADQTLLEELKAKWKEIDFPASAELEGNFNAAVQNFETQFTEWQAKRKEESRLEARELELQTKTSDILREQFAELLNRANDTGAANNISTLWTELKTVNNQLSEFKQTTQLDTEQLSQLSNTVSEALTQLEENIRQTKLLRDIQASLNKLKPNSPQREIHLSGIIKTRQQIMTNSSSADALVDIDKQITTIQKEIAQQKEQLSSLQTKIASELQNLGSLIEKGQSQLIGDAIKQLQTKLDKLEKLSPKATEKFSAQFKTLSLKAKELTDWKNWVASPKKEELINEMQSLIGITYDPHDLAQRIQKARNEWKRLGNSGRPEDIALWEKFNHACNLAYGPCQDAFNQETIKRSENGAARQTFIQALSAFVEQADWDNVDWKQVEKLLKDSRLEWREFGATERSLYKSLNEQFFKLTEVLNTKIQAQWSKSLHLKQNLVERAKLLNQNDNVSQAIGQAKELQTEWINAGRVSQKDERQLWKLFRQELDALFNKRKNLNEEKRTQDSQGEVQKAAVISQLEKLSRLERSELINSKPQYKQLKADWLEIGNCGKNERQLQNAFRDCEALYLKTFEVAEKQQQYLQLLDIGKGLAPNSAKQSYLQGLDELFADKSLQNSQSLINSKQNLCLLQMEILLGLETPAEHKSERMAYQIEQMNLGLGRQNDKDNWLSFLDLEAQWQWLVSRSVNTDTSQQSRHELIMDATRKTHSEIFSGI